MLWAVAAPERLRAEAREAIADGQNRVHVSAATVWEISIKQAIGKLGAPPELLDRLADAGYAPLPIGWAHAREAGSLPRHHADPFDRMLVAQARVEGLTVVTRDPAFADYGVPMLEA